MNTVNQMTPRDQRKTRKLWRKIHYRRRRLAPQDISNAPGNPPSLENEFPPKRLQRTSKKNRNAHAKQHFIFDSPKEKETVKTKLFQQLEENFEKSIN